MTDTEIQQMIHKRRLKNEEIKCSVKISKDVADREKLFRSSLLWRSLLTEAWTSSQKKSKANRWRRRRRHKISELKKRSTEVEQLSLSEDLLPLLQCFLSVKLLHPLRAGQRSESVQHHMRGLWWELWLSWRRRSVRRSWMRLSWTRCSSKTTLLWWGGERCRLYFEVQVNGKTKWE